MEENRHPYSIREENTAITELYNGATLIIDTNLHEKDPHSPNYQPFRQFFVKEGRVYNFDSEVTEEDVRREILAYSRIEGARVYLTGSYLNINQSKLAFSK